MIDQRRLECVSCGSRTTTRTGIGHGVVQKHKFACRTCAIEIGFVLHLDQEAVTYEYEDPTNARWIDGHDDDTTVLFYPEVMIPKDLQYLLSPFVVTSGNFKDIQEYQQIEAARREIKDRAWPVLQRVYVHFENKNWELLKKDASAIVRTVPDLPDEENWARWLMDVSRHYFDFFVVNPDLIKQTGVLAVRTVVKNQQALRALADQYAESGRTAALWKEIKSVRRQFMELYESLLPLLMMRRHWIDEKQDVDQYEVSVKNFEDLKGFYIDCVETSFRLLVIGMAFALIEARGSLTIQTAKGEKDIWWFEQMNNGNKNTQLVKYPLLAELGDRLDLGLRNGVGHHSAHYEVRTDEIVYVKADDALLDELRVPYTRFVDKVLGAYDTFESTTMFFHFLFVGGKGRL